MRLLKSLVEKAAYRLDQVDENGNTPLHQAVILGRKEISKYILSRCKYLVAHLNYDGLAPVHLALQENNPGLIELLLWVSADKRVKTRDGLNLLQYSVKYTHHTVLKWMLRTWKQSAKLINERNENGQTALHLAASTGCRDSIKLLVVNGGDLNIRDVNGLLPVHVALASGYYYTAEYLASMMHVQLHTIITDTLPNGQKVLDLAKAGCFDPLLLSKLERIK